MAALQWISVSDIIHQHFQVTHMKRDKNLFCVHVTLKHCQVPCKASYMRYQETAILLFWFNLCFPCKFDTLRHGTVNLSKSPNINISAQNEGIEPPCGRSAPSSLPKAECLVYDYWRQIQLNRSTSVHISKKLLSVKIKNHKHKKYVQ